MSLLPFAEAMCRIEVVGNVVTASFLSAYSSPNWNGESPFEYGHSQDESRTTYAGEIYALWQQGYELLLDFSAFSDVDTNYTWDATGLTGTWGIAPNGDTAQVQWQDPIAGVYDLQVTATNSAGQGVIPVRVRVVPESRAWNIRREHTSVVTCVWYGQTRNGAVWGNQYRNFGYYHLPYVLTGPNDAVGVVRSYIRNNDFIYLAGELDYQIFPPTGEFIPGSSFVGPDGPLPQVPQGLLTRASIGQQIQDWVKEARDALEFFNDQQAHFSALLANQLAQMQVEADMARAQAEWEAEYGPKMRRMAFMEDVFAWGHKIGTLAPGLGQFVSQFEDHYYGAEIHGFWGGVFGYRTAERYNVMVETDADYGDMLTVVGVYGAADIMGVTSFAEAWGDIDSVSLRNLSDEERAIKWFEGSVAMGGYALMAGGGAFARFKAPKMSPQGLALSEAELAQGAKPRPGAAGGMVKGNYSGSARSGGGGKNLHPDVQAVLDKVDPSIRSPYHGKCAEPRLISDALNSGVNPRGGTVYTVKIKAPGNPGHGSPLAPCSTCAPVLEQFGMKWAPTVGSKIHPGLIVGGTGASMVVISQLAQQVTQSGGRR